MKYTLIRGADGVATSAMVTLTDREADAVRGHRVPMMYSPGGMGPDLPKTGNVATFGGACYVDVEAKLLASLELFRKTLDFVAGPLFIGVYPAGLVYADKRREKHGDYAMCAFLGYRTLEIELEDDCPADLLTSIKEHAAGVQAKSGEQFQVSASGQTVLIGSYTNTQKRSVG